MIIARVIHDFSENSKTLNKQKRTSRGKKNTIVLHSGKSRSLIAFSNREDLKKAIQSRGIVKHSKKTAS